jgi:hypothetical protein
LWIGKAVTQAIPEDEGIVTATILRRMHKSIEEGSSSSDAVLGAVVTTVNERRRAYNAKFPERRPEQDCNPDRGTDVPLCDYLCRAVDGLAYAQLLAFLSTQRRDLPAVKVTLGRVQQLKPTEVLRNSLAVPQFLVLRAQSVFDRDAKEGRGLVNVGTRLGLFVEIYNRLAPIVNDPLVESGAKALQGSPNFITALFDKKELGAFRSCLLQAWEALESLFKDEMVDIPQLRSHGNPVTLDTLVPFTKLLFWFGVWDEIPIEYEVELVS